jgi:hypothetical protein
MSFKSRASVMDFDRMIRELNEMLLKEHPATFSSTWILKRSPRCYRFILKNVRTDFGTVDWDCVTRALEYRFQRLWIPKRKSSVAYRNYREVKTALKNDCSKLYVFLSPQNRSDLHTADLISVALVRLAQRGNESAKWKLMELLAFTVDDWINRYSFLSRWRCYKSEIQTQVERCIRRYRYSGSFLRYLLRTLEYSGRGLPPAFVHSLDAESNMKVSAKET